MAVAMSGKQVLVTGGAGFLGSHLCERLLDDGWDVLCVDNYYTGTKDNITHMVSSFHHIFGMPRSACEKH